MYRTSRVFRTLRIARSRKPLVAVLAAVAIVALVIPSQTAYPDDRDLLRFNTAKPYLFILLDTSGSMNLEFGADNVATAGHGDDPASKIWAAKESLFTVFRDVNDVHFGFAGYNQDILRVTTRHWLYFVDEVPSGWTSAFSTLGWPRIDPDGRITTDLPTVDTDGDGIGDAGDGFPDGDIEDGVDVLVFGRLFDPVRLVDSNGNPLPGRTCGNPLDISTEEGKQRLNAFAKLGDTGGATTTLWVSPSGGSTFRLVFERPSNAPDGTPNATLGQDNLHVRFELTEVADCSNPPNSPDDRAVFKLRLDPELDDFLMVDRGVPGNSSGNNADEWTANRWPWTSAVTQENEDPDDNLDECTSSSPFSGKGWEGNYDSDVTISGVTWDEEDEEHDRFCLKPDNASVNDACQESIDLKPMEPTTLSNLGRALDTGDMLPFNWETDNRVAFLQRLAPNWPDETPDFGVMHHLERLPATTDSDGVTTQPHLFRPRLAGREPLIAVGNTPLGKAINDVRCWYMGSKGTGGTNKCSASPFFDTGWSDLACDFDDEYGCRKPFLIMITDGDDTCAGENPGADVSDMKSFTGVQTWALNLGDPRNCTSGTLSSIVTRADGQCINVANKEELKSTLRDILGQVREQSRAFASAAVPSVQATADQALYISNFTPINNQSVWDGHLNAFLKPLPTNPDNTPNTNKVCGANERENCFLWDAGTVMEGQVAGGLGANLKTNRRVFFGQLEVGDELPQPIRSFKVGSSPSLAGEEGYSCTGCDPDNRTDICNAACFDPLDAFGIGLESGLGNANTKATNTIAETMALKTAELTGPDGSKTNIQFILGDIFHSNPIVVGTPNNVQYFAKNVGNDGSACAVDDNGNPGYRCFLQRQRFRRKVILVGSNDGQLHAFNAGFFERGVDNVLDGRYSDGTGHELWSFMPRAVMSGVHDLAEGEVHKFTVDGTPAVADVFIDPEHAGTPTTADRRWRTVAVSGLREGGSAYFALDITQPDKIEVKDGVFVPIGSEDALPGCAREGGYAAAQCGALEYPTPLWEMSDTTQDSILTGALLPTSPVRLDEDANSTPDLGETWSTPVIGRIRICPPAGVACDPDDPTGGGDLEDVYVAIFGGGMDPDNKTNPKKGDWLYIMDVERGKVIYKRRLVHPDDAGLAVTAAETGGSAPMEPAAVDTDQDSYLDRIYIGTTKGFMYRVDLTPDSSGNLPKLGPHVARGIDGLDYATARIPAVDIAGNPVWQPRVVFDANFNATSESSVTATTLPRPLFHRPSVVFVAKFGLFALAFGSGDREDLWNEDDQEGRFYIFLDDTDGVARAEGVDVEDVRPRNEGDFQRISTADVNLTEDLFVTRSLGSKGWFLVLDQNERVITNSFSLAGVTFFSSFQPQVALTDDPDCDPLDPDATCSVLTGTCGEKTFEANTDGRCAKGGFSRLFVVGTTNANAFLTDADTGNQSRFEVLSTFVTNPFTEPGSSPGDGTTDDDDSNSDLLTQSEIDVMQSLMSLFPENCNFANYRIDIKTIAADTRIERIAPVPICIVEKNWKEF